MNTPLLTTERLLLRPISLTDAPAIQKHINNWAVVRELSSTIPWPYPDDGAEQFLSQVLLPAIASGARRAWVLVERAGDDQAIGMIGMIGMIEYRVDGGDAGNRGFWLAEPWWGRGLMTEATWAMHDWLFFELGIEELLLCNAATNERSRGIKQKSGAQYVGELHFAHHHGESRSEKWRLTQQGWRQFRSMTVDDHSVDSNE